MIKLSMAKERSCIDRFHERLGEIEQNRKLLAKAVMKKYREIFHSISYTSLIDIQGLLKNEIRVRYNFNTPISAFYPSIMNAVLLIIQEYNKTVLTNFKVYEDLHLHMSIRIDDRSEELLSWLEAMKNKRSAAIRDENRKELMQAF